LPKEILKCRYCGFESLGNRYYWRCPKCGKPLIITYEDFKAPTISELRRAVSKLSSIWVFSKWLPQVSDMVTLGEGLTPIVRKVLRGVNVYFKLDYLNPTGSFKDRGASLTISKVLSLGLRSVVEDSSGNAGVSITCYGVVAGLSVRVYAPKTSLRSKLDLIRALGGKVVETKDRYEANVKALNGLSENEVYVGHLWNPYFIEGLKTLAYELAIQLGKVLSNETYVLIPTSSGGNLLGCYKGFKEAIEGGVVIDLPKLIAIQAQSPAPIYEGFHNVKLNYEETTLADGLRVKNPPRLNEIINALRESRGGVIIVTDQEILRALKALLKMGFIVEPTSATAYAAFNKLVDDGVLGRGDNIVLILTGSGLKSINDLLRWCERQGSYT